MSRAKQIVKRLVEGRVLLAEMPEIVSKPSHVTHGRNFTTAYADAVEITADIGTIFAQLVLFAEGIRGVTARRKNVVVRLPRSDFPNITTARGGYLRYEDHEQVIAHPLVQAELEKFKQQIGFYTTRPGPQDELAKSPETASVRTLASFSKLLRNNFPEVYFVRMGKLDGDSNQRKLLDLASRVKPDETIVKITSRLESATPIYLLVDDATKEKIFRAYAASEMNRAV